MRCPPLLLAFLARELAIVEPVCSNHAGDPQRISEVALSSFERNELGYVRRC